MIIGSEGRRSIPIDLEALMTSRLLLQANSGAGKSWALRRILEETHGKVQQVVIDLDDEFYTLREKHDYILFGGQDSDAGLGIRSANLLARRLLEMNASAILSVNDLKKHERLLFVQRFLESLLAAPKSLWKPLLVVIDEAHVFAPEKGKSESLAAVVDLMCRGRKRGFCGLLATQRLSKLHKDAAAEANNYLIGRAALDLDRDRASETLGFTGKEMRNTLRTLSPGTFYCFGPAFSNEVIKIKVGSVKTSHPKPGKVGPVIRPPKGKIKRLLLELEDLPKQADQEAVSLEEAKGRISDLRREIVQLKKTTPQKEVTQKKVEIPILKNDQIKRIEQALKKVANYLGRLDSFQREEGSMKIEISSSLSEFQGTLEALIGHKPREIQSALVMSTLPVQTVTAAERIQKNGGPAQRILDSLAWWNAIGVETPTRHQVAFAANYTPGGHFNNIMGQLKKESLVEYSGGGTVMLTGEGQVKAKSPEIQPTQEGLHRSVLNLLNLPMQKIVNVLLESWPNQISREQLATSSGYTVAGHFSNMLGKLKRLGLCKYPGNGNVIASQDLFFRNN